MSVSKDRPEAGTVPSPFSTRAADKATWLEQTMAGIEAEKVARQNTPYAYGYAYGRMRALMITAIKMVEESDPATALKPVPVNESQTTICDAFDDAEGQGRR